MRQAKLEPIETEFLDSDTKFFIPHTKKSELEAAHQAIIDAAKSQFKWPVTGRRISSLTYVDNRKLRTARVGSREEMEGHYEVVAILESTIYIIVTRTLKGLPGPLILVGTDEVTKVTSFKAA